MYFFEAGILCIIGIPIGIICGIIGTRYYIKSYGEIGFAMMFTDSGTSRNFTYNAYIYGGGCLQPSNGYHSYWYPLIPAVKAVRLTVLQALKQNDAGLKKKCKSKPSFRAIVRVLRKTLPTKL